jgi:hypothetical protein
MLSADVVSLTWNAVSQRSPTVSTQPSSIGLKQSLKQSSNNINRGDRPTNQVDTGAITGGRESSDAELGAWNGPAAIHEAPRETRWVADAKPGHVEAVLRSCFEKKSGWVLNPAK